MAFVFERLMKDSPLAVTTIPTFRTVDFSLRPERINYTMTDNGLEISIELGDVLPRIATILRFLEYRLSLLGD
jgi:hypothetical protein